MARGQKKGITRPVAGPLAGLYLALAASTSAPWPLSAAEGSRAMVATVHPMATETALDVLRSGGNAVDAAVAAALMLGVVDGHNSGIGGGCFLLIRTPDGTVTAIDGRETAPAAAHREMYFKDGVPQPQLSRTGPLAVAVPGALAAYDLALRQYGRKSLAELLEPAAKVAEEGFPINGEYATRLRSVAEQIRLFPATRSLLLDPHGQPWPEGTVLRQPDLARTYRNIARHGLDWFYRGPFAQAVDQWMEQHGGILAAEDFAAYRPKVRKPIVTRYRRWTIYGFPPPSSGGIHVAQILNILESFDLKALNQKDPVLVLHVVAEAMKRAFADRAFWLGDADFVPVPRGLVDKEYAQRLARQIRLDRSTEVPRHGQPPGWPDDVFNRHTTHIAAVDAEGYWVALTATINTTFGSKVIVPGTGVVLNNEMDDFAIHPGVPNAFGLVGADANAVAPGKRPLSSMSPTIVTEGGRPVVTVGAAGGPRIITQVVLTLVRHLDLEMPIQDAVAAPRIHHQWRPDVLYLEQSAPDRWEEGLRALGHPVTRTATAGVCQAIAHPRPDGPFVGVHDPRVPGRAAGW